MALSDNPEGIHIRAKIRTNTLLARKRCHRINKREIIENCPKCFADDTINHLIMHHNAEEWNSLRLSLTQYNNLQLSAFILGDFSSLGDKAQLEKIADRLRIIVFLQTFLL